MIYLKMLLVMRILVIIINEIKSREKQFLLNLKKKVQQNYSIIIGILILKIFQK